MAETALLQLHQRFKGRGQVYLNGGRLADVVYRLQEVEQAPRLLLQEFAAVEPARVIFGTLKSRNFSVLAQHIGRRLTLQLEDGQHLSVTVVRLLENANCLVQILSAVE